MCELNDSLEFAQCAGLKSAELNYSAMIKSTKKWAESLDDNLLYRVTRMADKKEPEDSDSTLISEPLCVKNNTNTQAKTQLFLSTESETVLKLQINIDKSLRVDTDSLDFVKADAKSANISVLYNKSSDSWTGDYKRYTEDSDFFRETFSIDLPFCTDAEIEQGHQLIYTLEDGTELPFDLDVAEATMDEDDKKAVETCKELGEL